MFKFEREGVTHYTGVDLAQAQLDEAAKRLASSHRRSMKMEVRFVKGDLTLPLGPDVRNVIRPHQFDLVSCQFAFHYACSSETRARQWLKTVASSLRPGGIFVAIWPSEERVRTAMQNGGTEGVARLEASGPDDIDWTSAPADFGIEYVFNLPEAIDSCPEFLVPRNKIEMLARSEGLHLEKEMSLGDLFHTAVCDSKSESGRALLLRMGVLSRFEPLPTMPDMSANEWQTAHFYSAFQFRKGMESESGSRYLTPTTVRSSSSSS